MQDTLKDLVSAQGPYRPLGKAQHMCVNVYVKLVLGVRTSALAFLLVTLHVESFLLSCHTKERVKMQKPHTKRRPAVLCHRLAKCL